MPGERGRPAAGGAGRPVNRLDREVGLLSVDGRAGEVTVGDARSEAVADDRRDGGAAAEVLAGADRWLARTIASPASSGR
jgi:hypothetical protein